MRIDAMKELCQKDIKAFGDLIEEDAMIVASFFANGNEIPLVSAKKSDFTSAFLKDAIFSHNDETEIKLSCNSNELVFNGYNYDWWRKTDKRRNTFEANLNNTIKKKEKSSESTSVIQERQFCVAVATLIENELSHISYKSGIKKDVVDFINNEIVHRFRDELLKNKTVINLCFDEAAFNNAFAGSQEDKQAYKHSLEDWHTLEELVDIGIISTK